MEKKLKIAEFGQFRYFSQELAHFLIPLFGPTTVYFFFYVKISISTVVE